MGLVTARVLRRAMVIGVGVLLGGCGGVGPAATTPTSPLVLADCVWNARATAWLDTNEDGIRDDGEPPLAGVRFIVADTMNGYPEVAHGMSDVGGRARLTVFLPGCPRAAFVVSAQPPAGHRLTTPGVRPAAENATVEFGVGGDGGP